MKKQDILQTVIPYNYFSFQLHDCQLFQIIIYLWQNKNINLQFSNTYLDLYAEFWFLFVYFMVIVLCQPWFFSLGNNLSTITTDIIYNHLFWWMFLIQLVFLQSNLFFSFSFLLAKTCFIFIGQKWIFISFTWKFSWVNIYCYTHFQYWPNVQDQFLPYFTIIGQLTI